MTEEADKRAKARQVIRFSLLVCTLNRTELLRRCLASLRAQTYRNFEIIVVDQSDVINREIKDDESIKYIHIDERGLSNARNMGLKVATGDYVALIDDDATYDESFLAEAASFIGSRQERPGIVSGRGRDPETGSYLLASMARDVVTEVGYLSGFKYCMSAMMVIKRDVLDEGFDTDFGIGGKYYAAEESDIVFRALERGCEVMYNPAMIVFHPSDLGAKVDLEKVYRYSVGIGAVLKKHRLQDSGMRFDLIYLYVLGRSAFGSLLYRLGFKQHIKSLYALRGKKEGFRIYKPTPLKASDK